MSNTVQIKRGVSIPSNQLAPYELGYVVQYNEDGTPNQAANDANGHNWAGHLFIGGPLVADEDGVKSYGAALPIKTSVEAGALSGIVPLEKGGTGVDSLYEFRQLAFDRGINSDLVSGWCAQGFSLHYINSADKSITKPGEEGFVLNLSDSDTKVGQLWFSQMDGAICRRFPTEQGWSSWLPLLDMGSLSNGSLHFGSVDSNQTKWAINLKSSYGIALDGNPPSATNPPGNWGIGIKFHVNANAEERWSGIVGYAHGIWANETGLKFITKNSMGDTRTATFAEGIFTSPEIVSENNVIASGKVQSTSIYANYIESAGSMVTPKITIQETLVMTKAVLDAIYPVGSIYISVNSTSPTTLFGGTWERLKDKFLVGAGDTFNEPGGSTTHSHALGNNAYAKINHHGGNFYFEEIQVEAYKTSGRGGSSGEFYDSFSETDAIPLGGTTDSASNLPPYLPVYMWKRTA